MNHAHYGHTPAPDDYLALCNHAARQGLHVNLSAFPEHIDKGGRIIAPGSLNLLYVDSPQGTRLADTQVGQDLARAAAAINRKLGVRT